MIFKKIYIALFVLTLLATSGFTQSVEITSFNQNPLQVSPLLGADLTINFTYTSQSGSIGHNIYVGLEELDANNQFVKTIAGKSFTNQQAGTDVQKSVTLFVGTINTTSENLPVGHYYQPLVRLYDTNWNELSAAGYWNSPELVIQASTYTFNTNSIAKGADISWMTEMENQGFVWKDNNGNTKELMPLLKEYDISAVRLRVWVNPDISGANGWCDIEDMVVKAEKAKANNLDIMLTIHYSDWWADPGQQTKPAAWINYSVSQLESAVANHTTDILNALSEKGITPKWIQIGNETNDGMLWSTGRASTGGFANYAKFLNAGASAVKSFNSNIKTILHIAGGNNNSLVRWNVDGLINNGFQSNLFDIIGLSLYPNDTDWQQQVEDTYDNMIDLKSRYNKDVMMVEVGFSNGQPDYSYQYLTYMIEKTKQANGLGVFFWEPIAHKGWKGYSKGAWDEDGSPSLAMDAFIDKSTLSVTNLDLEMQSVNIYPNPSSNQLFVRVKDIQLKNFKIYDLRGQIILNNDFTTNESKIDIKNLSAGFYILKINDSFIHKFLKN